MMSSRKITDLNYHNDKVKIGSISKPAQTDIGSNQKSSVDDKSSVKQPKLDFEKLRSIYASELDEIKDQVKEDAKDEGLEEGIKIAQADFDKKHKEKLDILEKQIELLKSTNEKLSTLFDKNLKELDSNIIEVIYKIIGSLVQQPEFYADFIKSTLQKISKKHRDEPLKISIHPKDKALLESSDLEKILDKITIYEDASLSQGGVVIESEQNTIDSRLENILSNTKKLLLTAYND